MTTIDRSTVSGNSATRGGGILNTGDLTVFSSTIAANTASDGFGLGLYHVHDRVTLDNTIIANEGGEDCRNSIGVTSLGHNLDSDDTCGFVDSTDIPMTDPLLAPLGNNGGPTQTHALTPGSPAIDAGNCPGETGDQRGFPRPVDVDGIPNSADGCDIGAFEFQPPLCDEPSPLSQGYWHRQCLGVLASEGGIDPGRNGRGPQEPTELDFTKGLMPAVTARLENLLFEMGGACAGGMDADPPSDKCEKAIKQFTALLFNLESERVQDGCSVDLSEEGCASTDIGSLVDELAALINSGDEDACKTAASCAGAVNEGTALTEASLVVQTTETEMPLNEDLGDLDWRLSAGGGAGSLDGADTGKAAEEVDAEVPVATVNISAPIATETEEPREAPSVEEDDPLTLQRHLAVLANPSAPGKAHVASRDALLTALSGGHDLDIRLDIAEALVGRLDAAFSGLLAVHLEDIRTEAVEFGQEDMARRAEGLLERLGGGD
jgi:hypothetical protein